MHQSLVLPQPATTTYRRRRSGGCHSRMGTQGLGIFSSQPEGERRPRGHHQPHSPPFVSNRPEYNFARAEAAAASPVAAAAAAAEMLVLLLEQRVTAHWMAQG